MKTEIMNNINGVRTSLELIKGDIIGFVVINNKIDSFITEISPCGDYFDSFKITSMLGIHT